MTTSVSKIISDAYRESNINALGMSPSALQVSEALPFLQRIISNAYGSEEGERLNPLPLGRNGILMPAGYPYYDQSPPGPWWVPANVRLMLNLEAPLTAYLDPRPMDGQRLAYNDKSNNLTSYPLTLIGNGRTINGADQLVVNTNGVSAEYLYRDDTGDWAVVTPLSINDLMPFPDDFDDFFIIGLAMRLNPRNGPALDPQSQAVYKSVRNDFIARYRQKIEVGSELGLVRTPGVRYNYYNQADITNQQFALGYPGIRGPY